MVRTRSGGGPITGRNDEEARTIAEWTTAAEDSMTIVWNRRGNARPPPPPPMMREEKELFEGEGGNFWVNPTGAMWIDTPVAAVATKA